MRRIICAAIAVGALACPGQADTITSFAEANIQGATTTDSDTTTLFNDPIAASVNEPGGFFTNVSADAAQNITVLGAKGAVAVDGVFASGGRALDTLAARNTLVSTASTNGTYQFSMFLTGAELRVIDFAGAGPFTPGAPTATYDVSVILDRGGATTTLFSSSATLVGGQSGHTLAKGGEDLGSTFVQLSPANFGYDFDPLFRTFDLGLLDAGDFITYEMSVSLVAASFELGGSAYIGDPNDLDGNGSTGLLALTGSTPPPTPDPVPEPGTLLLLGSAGVLAILHRRRINSARETR